MGVCNTMTKEENIVARLTVITLDALRDHKPIAVSTARDALDLLNDQAVAYKKLEVENARLREAVLTAYHTGHEHTVEGGFQWCAVGSQEVADEIIAEALNPTSAGDK